MVAADPHLASRNVCWYQRAVFLLNRLRADGREQLHPNEYDFDAFSAPLSDQPSSRQCLRSATLRNIGCMWRFAERHRDDHGDDHWSERRFFASRTIYGYE